MPGPNEQNRIGGANGEGGADWSRDRRGLSNVEMLPRLAELLEVPQPPNTVWRAATVTLFATDPANITSAYLQHIQDLDWQVPEEQLLILASRLLQHRAEHTEPM
ncbi:hypothetical protein CLV47_10850 [Antricoccus suffuscus]|uniref:Uncharacterized protein n=1 Tax=Antricoccus suffuscus TaxID=1629062 RepID=A0A2T0ZZA9_9ACTN|nr:hypothetical protein [Antricoccus suffuscus]PRZ41691.1 hypothetical protein CLV47_10850 [Antricoccus suffuscus]